MMHLSETAPETARPHRMAAEIGVTLNLTGSASPLSQGATLRLAARCGACLGQRDCDRLLEQKALQEDPPAFCSNRRTLRFLRDYQPHLGLMRPASARGAPASGKPEPELP